MTFSRQASGGLGLGCICCLNFDLSFAIANHSSSSVDMWCPTVKWGLTRSPASYPKSSVDNRPAENALPNLSATAVAPPGSWEYVRLGQPNEETDCKRSCRCQGGPSDGKDYFVVPPSPVGGNSSSLHDSQDVDELATLDRNHHFHGRSGLCA